MDIMDMEVLVMLTFGIQVITLLVLITKDFTKPIDTVSKAVRNVVGIPASEQGATATQKPKAQPKKKPVAKKKPARKPQPKKSAVIKRDSLEDLDSDIESLDDHEFDALDDYKDR